MGLGGLTWHHKEVGMKWQFDDWERWFSWGLVMKHWEFSQSSAMVNNWDFTFKIQAFLPCRCCLDSCGWRNLSTNNGMVNVVHLHMHSSSPEQNLPDFQVHKTLDSLDATGAVSDIPPKKIRCVWACLSWCFCPFFAGPRDGPWDGRTLWWSLWRTRWSRLRWHALWSRGLLKGVEQPWGIWRIQCNGDLCKKSKVFWSFGEFGMNIPLNHHRCTGYHRISTPYWGGRTPIHQLSYFDVESSRSDPWPGIERILRLYIGFLVTLEGLKSRHLRQIKSHCRG